MNECEVCANADNESCFACDNGNQFKPITNVKRIRRMTEEELAEWICRKQFREGDFCPPVQEWRYCQMADGCRACWLDWLKSPAEVDE